MNSLLLCSNRSILFYLKKPSLTLASLFLLCLSSPAFAQSSDNQTAAGSQEQSVKLAQSINIQQSGSIRGTVTTSDGQPAEFVTIGLKGASKSTAVDKKGNYQINRVLPGNYTLTTRYVGLVPQSKTVELKAGETLVVDFVLSENHEQLKEVVIGGDKPNKFAGKKSEYVARMPLSNLENPQVYSVVSKELMQEQMVVDYKDALWNSPGVVPGVTPAGTIGVYLRGFSVSTSVRNGMAAQAWSSVDPINIERAEIIKGPSGTLFGSSIVSFGGLINQVTKKPFDTFKGEISSTVGSYNLSRVTADINSPLNADKSVLLRVNTAYHNEGSFQNIGHNRSFTFAPSLSYKVDDRLTLLFDAEIFTQNKTQNPYPTFNAGLFTSLKDVPLDYRTSYGGENIDARLSSRNFYTQGDYKISDNWKSTTQVAYSNNHVERSLQMYPVYLTATSVARSILDFGPRDFNSIDFQQNFTGDFKLGSLRNRLVAGLDVFTYDGKQRYSNQIAYDVIPDITKPFAAVDLPKYNLLAANGTYSSVSAKQDIYSAYASDVLNITDKLEAMMSLRVDRFKNKPTLTNGVAAKNNYNQTALSPKFGLVYQLVKDQLSLFANYMNGFSNVGPVTQPDGSSEVFKPRQANQFEGGIKAEAFEHRLSASVSFYDIRVSNATYTELRNNLNFTVQNGTQRSRGFEAELIANPVNGLNIVAGYAYNENKTTKGTAALIGKLVQAAPQNVANFWVSYKFSEYIKNVGLGFGGNYVDKSYFDALNTLKIPSYLLLNASVFYDQPKWRFGLKGNNLGNEHYWNYAAAYQMTRQYLGSITFKF
ncbi:iron complex outermembrane recepter protein [Pedobacter westerhofensis]|uniref:Iron complex outermembrane recepter protein n=1 Tax=Pedobacter westerhofensis TaxID=425512 RepID=A0A521FDR7_9SPHI|nr:TonB-dependent receptor [Pedobacter westerhofensis]SMO94317.1 iron complex outermembrane recepter protein [Pedobacter westerhofensis]